VQHSGGGQGGEEEGGGVVGKPWYMGREEGWYLIESRSYKYTSHPGPWTLNPSFVRLICFCTLGSRAFEDLVGINGLAEESHAYTPNPGP
jgi:hypothetical protein